MEAVALSPESKKERLWRLDHDLLSKQMESLFRTQMSEEGNKNPRNMEGSAKALPLPSNLAGLSWSGTAMMSTSLFIGGSMRALSVRCTGAWYLLVDGEWRLAPR